MYQLSLGQLHSYKDYYKMKKVVQISIDSFDFLGFGDFIYNIFLMDEVHCKKITDKLHIIHINIDYLRKIDYNNIVNSNSQLMKDLYFLICGKEKLDIVYEGDDNLMKKIINEAKEIAGIEKMNLYLTDEEMIKNDQEYYKELGQQELIIAFYKNGASLDLISKSSGLSIDKINKIIKDYKKVI